MHKLWPLGTVCGRSGKVVVESQDLEGVACAVLEFAVLLLLVEHQLEIVYILTEDVCTVD